MRDAYVKDEQEYPYCSNKLQEQAVTLAAPCWARRVRHDGVAGGKTTDQYSGLDGVDSPNGVQIVAH
jgi:hypothetical protein